MAPHLQATCKSCTIPHSTRDFLSSFLVFFWISKGVQPLFLEDFTKKITLVFTFCNSRSIFYQFFQGSISTLVLYCKGQYRLSVHENTGSVIFLLSFPNPTKMGRSKLLVPHQTLRSMTPLHASNQHIEGRPSLMNGSICNHSSKNSQ